MAKCDLTAAYLRENYEYDAATGRFTKLKATGPKPIGSVVGYANSQSGYIHIDILGKAHRAHRLAWLYTHGVWPTGVIDHINGIHGDNRLCNLRDVTVATNGQNQRKPPKHNTTGHMGVSWCRSHKKYIAQITADNKRTLIGYFDNAEEAATAYIETKRRLHGGCVI